MYEACQATYIVDLNVGHSRLTNSQQVNFIFFWITSTLLSQSSGAGANLSALFDWAASYL